MLSFCVFKSTYARVQRRRRGAGAARRLGFRVWEFGVYIPVENCGTDYDPSSCVAAIRASATTATRARGVLCVCVATSMSGACVASR